MELLLVLTTVLIILLIIIIFVLFLKINRLYKKLKYVDEANKWHQLAVTDDLTGVYNRNAYNLHIDDIKDNNKNNTSGIIIFDIDNFKTINDTKGHSEGDEVLKSTAKILLDIFPKPFYSVFRIGGDEFSVLCDNVSEKDIIKRLLEVKSLETTDISLSKGYSMVEGNIDDAFRNADEMLYADKMSKK